MPIYLIALTVHRTDTIGPPGFCARIAGSVNCLLLTKGSPDLAIIVRLYADDFPSTNADGRVVDKQRWLDILKAGRP
jgi:hypothetical protein